MSTEAVVHPHDPAERAELFLGFNTGSTELEVLNWLYATILLLKPQNLVETGAADGLGTIALASACKSNGFGMVHSVELDTSVCAKAQDLLKREGLNGFVEFHCMDSLTFLSKTQLSFDLGFFDSICEIRAQECALCMERRILHGPAIFHDTSPYRTRTMKQWPPEPKHSQFRKDLVDLAARHFGGNFFESRLSRGLTVLLPAHYPPSPMAQ